MGHVTIGTRGSKLALWQAEHIAAELRSANPGLEVSLQVIKTTGDKIQDVPLSQVGGKGLFVKEIEQALLRGDIDLAVHSIKDVPAELAGGLVIAMIPEREDPRDALVCRGADSLGSLHTNSSASPGTPLDAAGGVAHRLKTTSIRPLRVLPDGAQMTHLARSGIRMEALEGLPDGALVGTSSLRRRCQLQSLRPDLQIRDLRGNVDTRLRKLDEGQYDAILLACAGLRRLGLAERITAALDPEVFVPAVGQGALGIEVRGDDERVKELLAPLHHDQTAVRVEAERSFLGRLGGGCQVPLAAHAVLDGGQLKMDAVIGHPSGSPMFRDSDQGPASDAAVMGARLADRLLDQGAGAVLEDVYAE